MPAGEPRRMVYRFDRFTLDLGRGALLGSDGAEFPLRPKSFALLRLFVENAGRLLDRDTIMAAVWPDLFVTDDSKVPARSAYVIPTDGGAMAGYATRF